MATKINNLSGINYGDEVIFNKGGLENVTLFNGFPVNTETFPTGSNYIWSFHTASRKNLGVLGVVYHQDYAQSVSSTSYPVNPPQFPSYPWSPSGWYGPYDLDTLVSTVGLQNSQSVGVRGKQRIFQTEARLGYDNKFSDSIEKVLGFYEEMEDDYDHLIPFTASLFGNAESPRHRMQANLNYESDALFDRGIESYACWMNGDTCIFATKTGFGSSDVQRNWSSSISANGGVAGYAMGSGHHRFADGGTVVFSDNDATHRGTPTRGTGPAHGPSPVISPFISTTAPQPEGPIGLVDAKDRFLYAETSFVQSNQYRVVRTPQRVFNYTPEDGISRKFFGFFYHAYSVSQNMENMANYQIYNGEPYITTVWATQYNNTSLNLSNYTHPPTGEVYEDYLIYQISAGGNDLSYLHPGPKFLGGIKLSDLGEYQNSDPDYYNRYWSNFPKSGSVWRSKVLEIPDEAFDWEGITQLVDDSPQVGAYSLSSPSVGDKEKGMYIYIVTSPKVGSEGDIAFCNMQIGEYDNALVPQTILDQLE